VLDLIVAEHCFAEFPDFAEGDLTNVRKAVVSTQSLARAAGALDLGSMLRLGNGEEKTGGRSKPALLADCYEAVLGAIYLDGGLDPARRFVLTTLGATIARAVVSPGLDDAKTVLQEAVVHDGGQSPTYTTVGSGPDHDRSFTATVAVGDRVLGTGSGRSKKAAEQAAAAQAVKEWNSARTSRS
jgi:ribonuclease III